MKIGGIMCLLYYCCTQLIYIFILMLYYNSEVMFYGIKIDFQYNFKCLKSATHWPDFTSCSNSRKLVTNRTSNFCPISAGSNVIQGLYPIRQASHDNMKRVFNSWATIQVEHPLEP